jgi:predicted transcriptional regulator
MRSVSRHLEKPQSALRISLGPLEARVMTVLWTCGECTVRQVQKKLLPKAAYTTVLTTMVRLYQKGLMKRRRHRYAFIYSAVSREQWGVLAASEFITHFIGVTNGSPELVASSLSEAISLHQHKLAGNNRP